MRKMPVNSLAVKGQLGVLCPLQGCHSFRYRSISQKDEYEIRIVWSNNILNKYINIVSSDNVFWSYIFLLTQTCLFHRPLRSSSREGSIVRGDDQREEEHVTTSWHDTHTQHIHTHKHKNTHSPKSEFARVDRWCIRWALLSLFLYWPDIDGGAY